MSNISNTMPGANVFGTSSKDTIYNSGRLAKVFAGSGDDRINNLNNDYSTIYCEDGDDTVSNNGRATIYGGNGNDAIYHDNDYSLIDGLDGNDKIYIENYGSNNTIIGGKDSNHIVGNGKSQVYLYYGDGYDTIENVGTNSTIKIATANYQKTTSGNNVIIKVGAFSMTLKDVAGTKLNIETFNPAEGTVQNPDENNNVQNDTDNVTLQAGKGKDTLINTGKKVDLYGGNDDDYLSNSGANPTLHGDGGNDKIFNSGSDASIHCGDGNDYLKNSGKNSTLYGDKGNDWINNEGNSVTITGGPQNDYIKNSGTNILFKYAEGDGDDLIEGFNSSSTLKITDYLETKDGVYTMQKDGSDVLVNVGKSVIILKGAASLSKINIVGKEAEPETVNSSSNTRYFTEGNDKVFNYVYGDLFITNTAIYLLGGDDSIWSENYTHFNSISGGNGKDTIDNSGGYVSISGDAGDDSIVSNGTNNTIHGNVGNDVIYNKGDNTKVFGDANNDSIKNTGDSVSVYGGDGSDTLVNYTMNKAYLDGGFGNDIISISGQYSGTFYYKGNTVRGGTGDDTVYNGGQEQIYKYFAGDGNDVIYGHHEKDTVCIVGAKYTSTKSGNDVIIKVGTGSITLKNSADKNINIDGIYDIAEPTDTLGGNSSTSSALNLDNFTDRIKITGTDLHDSIANYAQYVTIDGGKGSDAIVNYFAQKVDNDGNATAVLSNGDNAVIYGGDGSDFIYNYGAKATVNGGAGNDLIYNEGIFLINEDGEILGTFSVEDKFSIDGGAGNDYIYNVNERAILNGGTGDDVIDLQDSTNALVKYTAGDGNDTIKGFNTTSTLQIGGGTGTYSSAKSGDNLILTVGTGSITLIDAATQKLNILGKENSALNWKLNGTTATYGNSITVTGVKSLDGVSLNNKTVTLSNAALNQGTVTISDGYTLALGSDVAKSSTTAAKWTGSGSTYTYTAAGTSAGYKLSGNKISYTSASGGDKFTISGVKNTSAVTVSGKKVTVGNKSLNGKAVTLTGDFTLALGKDVATSAKKTVGAFTTVSKGTATYKTATTSDYYKISGKKISYTAGTGGQSITLKNLNTAATLSTVKNGVTVAEKSGTYNITFKNSAVLTTKAPTISVAKGLKYTVAVADSLKPVTKSAWTVSGTTATFRTNTTAGYSVNSKNAVVYSAQKTGSPLLELGGLAKGIKASSLTAPKNKVVTLNANVLGKNASLKSNGGGYTLNLTGNMSGKKFTGTGKVDTLTVAANNANVDLGAGNDVVTLSGLKVTLNGGAGNDKLTGSKNVDLLYGGAGNDSILGNAGNDKLYGDAGNDTLRGGAGNDTLTGGKGDDKLWGDAGKDTFLYSNGDGKDVIFGFENNDLLQITGVFSASYNKSKKEIAFKVGSTANAITLKDFTATSFHINGDTYGINGTRLVKK